MKNRCSNWQLVVSVILMWAVWFGALPVYPQIKQDGKGVEVKIVSELPPKEKRWALIVGIDKYERDVSTLQGAVNDARALKNVLVNYAGFPENQVVLLTSDAAEADVLPKRENILSTLGDLSQRIPPDGLLLFSFSGHGVSVGEQAFLIPSNGRITKNLSLLRSLSINVKDVQEAVREIKVKQVLMLLDACRNEPGKGDTPNVLTDAYKEGFSFDVVNSDVKAFATLYATSVGERAYEFYDKDTGQFRGYFSHAVEEALKGKAANEKGEVTLSRLIEYLETTVPRKVKYDKGETQIPMANYSETYRANQLILSVAKPSNSVPVQPKLPTQTPTINSLPNGTIPSGGNELSDLQVKSRLTVNFKVGSSSLSPKAKQNLDSIVKTAMTMNGYIFQVTGFSDSTGNREDNMILSKKRAQAVINYLVETHNIPLRRIATSFGLGDSIIVASNATKEGQAQNRRAEVTLYWSQLSK